MIAQGNPVYFNPNTNQYYTVNHNTDIAASRSLFPGAISWYYNNPAAWPSMISRNNVTILGGPSSSNQSNLLQSTVNTNYTPNQYTAAQLAETVSGSGAGASGGDTIPRWMQQAYANRMAYMGGSANGPLPYRLTDSSYRGMPASTNQSVPTPTGKAAPSGGA